MSSVAVRMYMREERRRIWKQQKEKREGKNIRGGKEGSDIGKEGIRK